jgi:mannose-1-phosphate guanylyltransferase/mannose-6-phosphate isomerase
METSRTILPLILCGGSGTRLWPVSTPEHPKQFVPLVAGRTLFETALDRAKSVSKGGPVLCVAASAHRHFVRNLSVAAGCSVRGVYEPVARNTAAAIALGVAGADDDTVMLVCPADHHIPDVNRFRDMVQRGVPAALNGAIVTFGVRPDHPSPAYGYVRYGELFQGTEAFVVKQFLEKPSVEVAGALMAEGDVLWNAGIFLATVGTLRAAFREHAPDILQQSALAMRGATVEGDDIFPDRAAFEACRSQSIDYAVLERHGLVATVPFDGVWNDLGGWRSVADLTEPDGAGNRCEGQVLVVDGRDNYARAGSGRKVVLIGVEGITVVETGDAILVMGGGSDAGLREAARWAGGTVG